MTAAFMYFLLKLNDILNEQNLYSLRKLLFQISKLWIPRKICFNIYGGHLRPFGNQVPSDKIDPRPKARLGFNFLLWIITRSK